MSQPSIKRLTTINCHTTEVIASLLVQLSPSCQIPSSQQLSRMIENPSTAIFLLHTDEGIAGMITVGNYFSPTGRKAWIEDVVVDSSQRGKGYGKKLLDHAIDYVRTLAPCTLMLTSNPSRIAANELYRSSGFEQKFTNVYKMNL